MVERKELLSLGYYKMTCFKGSDKDMRYLIEKHEDKEAGIKNLKATRWFGPLCYEATDPAIMESFEVPFEEEGLQAITDWLNSR